MTTILIIEDTQDNFDLIEDALEDMYELVHAATGPEGLHQATELIPDLILLDMGLPDMDGWEVVRHLKADPSLTRVPVIAITSHAMSGDREKCMEAGCDDYMAKPINTRELKCLIERNLAQAKVRQTQ